MQSHMGAAGGPGKGVDLEARARFLRCAEVVIRRNAHR
jgi:hypothetical protein